MGHSPNSYEFLSQIDFIVKYRVPTDCVLSSRNSHILIKIINLFSRMVQLKFKTFTINYS